MDGEPRRQTQDVEREIAGLLAAGRTRQAATLAIRAHGPAVLAYLRRLLDREVDAVEAFSVFCERFWRALPEFRGESALRTWAFRLAWSAASDLRKDAWRRGRRLETDEAERLLARRPSSSARRLEARSARLSAARERLSLEDRSLLQLRVDQGLSWAECAEILAASGTAVRPDALMKRFERLKKRLGRLMREGGGR